MKLLSKCMILAASLIAVDVLAADAEAVDGKAVYQANCAACHQIDGSGLVPAFPALKGSEVVNGDAKEQISLVLNGKPGTAMVSFSHMDDENLAAVITYVRAAWGNTGSEVTAEDVAANR